MTASTPFRKFTSLCLTALFCLSFFTASAGVIQISSTAPGIDGEDIAMLDLAGTITTGSGDLTDIWGDRPAQGQSFLTGSNPDGYLLSGVTLRTNRNNEDTTMAVRIGGLSGTDFSVLRSETAISPVSAAGDYITFQFNTPVTLAANTLYGFDWGAPGYTGTEGFRPHYTTDTGAYTGGSSYSSGDNGLGTATVTYRDSDKVFHLEIAAIPEPSSFLLVSGALLLMLLTGKRGRRATLFYA